ncbi:DUF1493 family protein [Saccharophagus degradans]|uniref:DUF1493 family protein n=1 Tax=Saccharophagus degradans TaxID=86304 RepID=A0AAW7X5J6_9GAMM|nr:DUF1493 family protein [Saccharophagus degradans]MDO6422800.1 DUF1493 family protein [Saccharophagus degradans]MDO6606273.1 DUF1493 family protein [Saccharophagus degradans]
MTINIEEIYAFLAEVGAVKKSKFHPESDFVKELGIEGDDFSEIIECFAEKYGVDMRKYRWYFHHGEEGWNLGALFIKPPYAQVQRIAVTPSILLQAAMTKKWPLSYPEHKITEGRPDITLNNILFVSPVVIGILVWADYKFGII